MRQDILIEIEAELARASLKHPKWPTDRLRQVVIIMEEAGELLQAMLSVIEHEEKGNYYSWDRDYKTKLEAVQSEAIQTASMAIRFLENWNAQTKSE